jgi:hypothetical protein
MINGRNFMKKYLYLCCILSTAILADDLDLGADFSAGDTITASEFNSKFNTIENVIKKFDESILIGTWSCREYSVGNINPDTGKFISEGSLNTVTFSETDNLDSINSPKTHSGFSFSQGNPELPATTYSVIGNYFVPTYWINSSSVMGVDDSQTFDIEMKSNNQFQMTATKSRSNNCSIPGCFVVTIICDKS